MNKNYFNSFKEKIVQLFITLVNYFDKLKIILFMFFIRRSYYPFSKNKKKKKNPYSTRNLIIEITWNGYILWKDKNDFRNKIFRENTTTKHKWSFSTSCNKKKWSLTKKEKD